MTYTQDFFTSRRNYNDGTTRINETGRLWYDPTTNTIRVSDGTTPGGIIVGGSGFNTLSGVTAIIAGPGISVDTSTGIVTITNIGGGGIGSNGYTGSVGATGLTGYIGSVGATGIQGIIGYTGSVGDTGIQGVIGYTGSVGATGLSGSAGLTGATGANGYTGSVGDTGIQGVIGYTGSYGSNGYTGSTGPGVTISDNPPPNPNSSDLWWDDVNGELYIFYNNAWVRANSGGTVTPLLYRPTVVITTSSYSASVNDWYIGINYAGSATVILPSGIAGQEIVVKDESGLCSLYPITIVGTIDNDAGGVILATNNGGIHMIYRAGWRII